MKAKSLLYDISILWWEAGPHEIDFADMDVFIQRLEALGKNIAFREDSDDIIATLQKQFAETPFSTQLLIRAHLDQLLSPEHRHRVRSLHYQLRNSCVLNYARARVTGVLHTRGIKT